MSGVWVFKKNGVMHLEEGGSKRKVLVHVATGQVVTSYEVLEPLLARAGWERYGGGDPALLQYHRASSIDLISLPLQFAKFTSVHMYDIVVKNPNIFIVRHVD